MFVLFCLPSSHLMNKTFDLNMIYRSRHDGSQKIGARALNGIPDRLRSSILFFSSGASIEKNRGR